jgi:hypothetical protein
MNIYRCWHQGILGYGCRRGSGWMFVPELGQPDDQVHKDLNITDLVFLNIDERLFEMKNDKLRNNRTLGSMMQSVMAVKMKPRSIGGRLFIPQ